MPTGRITASRSGATSTGRRATSSPPGLFIGQGCDGARWRASRECCRLQTDICICMHRYTYIHMHTRICIYIYIYACTHEQAHMEQTYTCMHTYAHMHPASRRSLDMHTYAHMHPASRRSLDMQEEAVSGVGRCGLSLCSCSLCCRCAPAPSAPLKALFTYPLHSACSQYPIHSPVPTPSQAVRRYHECFQAYW